MNRRLIASGFSVVALLATSSLPALANESSNWNQRYDRHNSNFMRYDRDDRHRDDRHKRDDDNRKRHDDFDRYQHDYDERYRDYMREHHNRFDRDDFMRYLRLSHFDIERLIALLRYIDRQNHPFNFHFNYNY